jgi:UDP-3-O-[3-hydroxymyristoyl] glucosamine N-acyltransferase
MSTIAATAIVYPNVQLGEGSVVGEFCIIGEPPRGAAPGDVPTVIGPGAVIRSHTVIYAGNVIGAGFQTGHSALLRESNTIGDDVSVGSHSIIEHHVQIADKVRIHSQAFIPEFSTLETGSWVGPGVRFTNAPHPLSPDAKDSLIGPTLAPGAKIGANATPPRCEDRVKRPRRSRSCGHQRRGAGRRGGRKSGTGGEAHQGSGDFGQRPQSVSKHPGRRLAR